MKTESCIAAEGASSHTGLLPSLSPCASGVFCEAEAEIAVHFVLHTALLHAPTPAKTEKTPTPDGKKV